MSRDGDYKVKLRPTPRDVHGNIFLWRKWRFQWKHFSVTHMTSSFPPKFPLYQMRTYWNQWVKRKKKRERERNWPLSEFNLISQTADAREQMTNGGQPRAHMIDSLISLRPRGNYGPEHRCPIFQVSSWPGPRSINNLILFTVVFMSEINWTFQNVRRDQTLPNHPPGDDPAPVCQRLQKRGIH